MTELIYEYDGSFDGFLCCIFDSYANHEVPTAIRGPEETQPTLFAARAIATDIPHARRVFRKVAACSPYAADLLRRGFLTCLPEKELHLYHLVVKLLRDGPAFLKNGSDDTLYPVLKAVRHLAGEAHQLKGFVRFSDLGGVLGGFLFCRYKKINFLSYFDLALPSVALAQGFGRIGCFLAGCCYGRPTDSPIGITFTNSAYAPNGISLIPTQLISSGLDFLHFFVLLYIARHKKAEGQVGGFYLIFYSIGRFILEYFRGDMERGSVGELSTSQFIAIFTLIAGIVIVAGSRLMASRNVRAFLVGPNGTAYVPAKVEENEETKGDTESVSDMKEGEKEADGTSETE